MAYLTKQQEISSNNLSNSNTPGYKKENAISKSFPEMLLYRLNDPSVGGDKPPYVGRLTMGVQLADIVTSYASGTTKQTGNPLQLALMDEGYFTVNTPQGERYTRNGEFNISPNGFLVTTDGYTVMGNKGAIVITGGEFAVDEQGRIVSGGREVDKLRIVNFAQDPVKEGSTLFRAENPEELNTSKVAQGYIESSNADSIEEMANMINISRAYEANQKVIQTMDGTLEKAVNEVGRL
jgi:flagellar basal-body rod protein FlgG